MGIARTFYPLGYDVPWAKDLALELAKQGISQFFGLAHERLSRAMRNEANVPLQSEAESRLPGEGVKCRGSQVCR